MFCNYRRNDMHVCHLLNHELERVSVGYSRHLSSSSVSFPTESHVYRCRLAFTPELIRSRLSIGDRSCSLLNRGLLAQIAQICFMRLLKLSITIV